MLSKKLCISSHNETKCQSSSTINIKLVFKHHFYSFDAMHLLYESYKWTFEKSLKSNVFIVVHPIHDLKVIGKVKMTKETINFNLWSSSDFLSFLCLIVHDHYKASE